MKKLITLLLAFFVSGSAAAAGGGDLEYSGVNVFNRSALVSGASTYVQYCSGCHTAQYVRYQRIQEDLELSDSDIALLMPPEAKIGDLMTIAMNMDEANEWFGKAPPDLSLIARSRSEDWLFTYLKSFYRDQNGEWGNKLFPSGLSMPHVMWREQGILEPVYAAHDESEGAAASETIDHLELVEPGLLSPEEYDEKVRDLVAYLSYMGEPARMQRHSLGWKVILFLALFAFLAYLLKAEYWRDVH